MLRLDSKKSINSWVTCVSIYLYVRMNRIISSYILICKPDLEKMYIQVYATMSIYLSNLSDQSIHLFNFFFFDGMPTQVQTILGTQWGQRNHFSSFRSYFLVQERDKQI